MKINLKTENSHLKKGMLGLLPDRTENMATNFESNNVLPSIPSIEGSSTSQSSVKIPFMEKVKFFNQQQQPTERITSQSCRPEPEKWDQHVVTSYSRPKGL